MRKLIQPFLLLLLIVIVFHSWFLPGLLSTYDFPYFSPLMMKDAGVIPYAWGWHVGLDGFAGFLSPYSWVFPFIYIPQVVFGRLGMDWAFIERIIYLYPFLILMIVSPILFTRYIFPKNKFYLFSVLIFSFNTYALLLAGGEVFLALSYSLAPMILMIFMKIVENKEQIAENKKQVVSTRYLIIVGLLLSVQIMLDPRISYVTISIIVIYLLFYCGLRINELRKYTIVDYVRKALFIFVIPLGITGLLNSFWIIPTVLHGGNPVEALGPAHSTVEAVKYFSFAKFENSISLLHPNWPENIFGKVGFMKPEFLVLPIMAYLSLLFVASEKRKTENLKPKNNLIILYFAFLGLVGAFLAKGANEPFGQVYLWMFEHVPGFVMFRDPAKWYPLVAISYSVLIPFSIWKIYEMLKSQPKLQTLNLKLKTLRNFFPNLFLTFVVLYFIFLIWPALFGQLGGMFWPTNVPQDYVKLEKFLASQPDYFRTLWYPSKQKFGYYSNTHPEISAQALFDLYDNKSLFGKLSEEKTLTFLEESSIKYVIVPYDSEKEIFLSDRKYDDQLYLDTINQLKAIKWLRQIDCTIVKLLNCSGKPFGKIVVFEVSNPKDHFYLQTENLKLKTQKVTFQYVSPVKYIVNVENVKKGDILVFSESYDQKWAARSSQFSVYSSKFGIFNSFVLSEEGNYNLEIYYTPQDWVNLGMYISIATLFAVILALVGLKPRK